MSEINIPAGGWPVTKAKAGGWPVTKAKAGGWPVTKTEAAGTAFGLRGGAEKPRQKPAAWAGKEGKV